MDGWFPVGIFRNRSTFPLHPGIEHPQNEIKDAMIAHFALWSTLGHREVRQDKCGEIGFGEWDGDRRRCRLCYRYAHHARTYGKDSAAHWRIQFLHILKKVRGICKTRNHL